MENGGRAGAGASAPEEDAAATPLVVDLDGTLTPTDTLHEALLRRLAARPLDAARLLSRLGEGRATLKAELAAEEIADPASLPLRSQVVALIEKARANGRRVILVTAADERVARAVADYLGLFDEVKGSDGRVNLKGPAKAEWLVERYGRGGFDYVGDAAADIPVWAAARRAYSAGAGARLRERLEEARGGDASHLAPAEPAAALRAWWRAARPHQWLKNLLIFVPAFAAHDIGAMARSLPAFVAFCLAASAVYLINDMLDLATDRAHPRKARRPFAAGALTVRDGALTAGALLLASLLLALLLAEPLFLLALLGYIALTFAYSLLLKRKLFLDVWTLAGLYTLRIIAGGAAAALPLSPWLLAFSMFLFLSLAAVKRQAEMTDVASRGESAALGRAYTIEDLPVLLGVGLAAGYNAVLVFALYISSDRVAALYGAPWALWLVCPILLYWISRMVALAHRGRMEDDPIVFALRDPVSLTALVASVAIVLFAAAG